MHLYISTGLRGCISTWWKFGHSLDYYLFQYFFKNKMQLLFWLPWQMWQRAHHLYGVKCSFVFGEMSETILSLRKCQRQFQVYRKVQNSQFCAQVCGRKIFLSVALSLGFFSYCVRVLSYGEAQSLAVEQQHGVVKGWTQHISSCEVTLQAKGQTNPACLTFASGPDPQEGQCLWVSCGSRVLLGCINTFPRLKSQRMRRVALTWGGFDHYLH